MTTSRMARVVCAMEARITWWPSAAWGVDGLLETASGGQEAGVDEEWEKPREAGGRTRPAVAHCRRSGSSAAVAVATASKIPLV